MAHTQIQQLSGGRGIHVRRPHRQQVQPVHKQQHCSQRRSRQREPPVHPGQERQYRRDQEKHGRNQHRCVQYGIVSPDHENTLNIVGVGGKRFQCLQISAEYVRKGAVPLPDGIQVFLCPEGNGVKTCVSPNGSGICRLICQCIRHLNGIHGQQHHQQDSRRQHTADQPERPVVKGRFTVTDKVNQVENEQHGQNHQRDINPCLQLQENHEQQTAAQVSPLGKECTVQHDGQSRQQQRDLAPLPQENRAEDGRRRQQQRTDQRDLTEIGQHQRGERICRQAVVSAKGNIPQGNMFGEQGRSFFSKPGMNVDARRR